jgi:hypothetical protein
MIDKSASDAAVRIAEANARIAEARAGADRAGNRNAAIRRSLLLGILLVWTVSFVWPPSEPRAIEFNHLIVFVLLCLLYVFEMLYTTLTSAGASESAKSFMLQTAVPIIALAVVGTLSYYGKIDSAATVTLFGVSLGYTGYVVNKSKDVAKS